MRVDTFLPKNVKILICGLCGFMLFPQAPLAGQQYFDQYHRYSIWPPSFWKHQSFMGGEVAKWESPDGAVHIKVEILDRTRFTDLLHLGRTTFSSWGAKYTNIKVNDEDGLPEWLAPLLSLRGALSSPQKRTSLTSFRKANGQQGWMLLHEGPRWHYRVSVTGPPVLEILEAAQMLSSLDSFALLEQELWLPGAVSTVYRSLLDPATEQPAPLPFKKEKAQWRAEEWRADRATSEAQISREYLLAVAPSPQMQYAQLERYYRLLFRFHFFQLQPLLRLLSHRPLTLPTPQEGETLPQPDDTADTSTEDAPPLETSQDTEEQENDSIFSYLNDEVDEEGEEDDFDSLFANEGFSIDDSTLIDDTPDSSEGDGATETTSEGGEEGEGEEGELPLLPLAIPLFDDIPSEEGAPSPQVVSPPAITHASGRRLLTAEQNSELAVHSDVVDLLYELQNKTPVKTPHFPIKLQDPLANFWQDAPDLDTLLLAATILLSQLGYNSAIIFSDKHNYSLLGVDMTGRGARVRWFNRNYLLFDLGQKVKAGWVPRETAQLKDWQAVSFPAYRPPRP